MKDLRKIIGNNIVFYRKVNNLTQEKLAELIKIAPPSLSAIEKGNSYPARDTLTDIINVLKIRPYQLFITEDDNLAIDDVELALVIQEKFKGLDDEAKKAVFRIINALANESK